MLDSTEASSAEVHPSVMVRMGGGEKGEQGGGGNGVLVPMAFLQTHALFALREWPPLQCSQIHA